MSIQEPLLHYKPKFVFWIFSCLFGIPLVISLMGIWATYYISHYNIFPMKSNTYYTTPDDGDIQRIILKKYDTLKKAILIISVGQFLLCFFIFIMIKKSYAATRYNFYADRVEFHEGFLVKRKKIIELKRINEVSLREGILQRMENLGSIYLATAATGVGHYPNNLGYSGTVMRDIENPHKVLEEISSLIKKAGHN